MSAAFFSKKQSPEEKTESEVPVDLLAVVHTMEEDLDDIRHGRESSSPQVEEQEAQNNAPKKMLSRKVVNPFSEEGEKAFQSQVEENTGRPKNGLSGRVPDGKVMTNQPEKSNLILWISIVLTLIIIIGGVFYFFFQRNQMEVVAPTPSLDAGSNIPTEVTGAVPQDLPFALDKPNPISFNTETVSSEDMRKTLSQVALRIKTANIVQPIEFFVTDQNNNPLAFSRFAFLLKLDLDSDTLALVNETFSLYVYNDAGNMRLGLGLTFKDAVAAALAIAKTETNLPYALQSLILEPGIQVPQVVSFQSSTYNPRLPASLSLGGPEGQELPVRFANVNSDQNISFDYMLRDTKWFIGTSKNTLRAILDAYAQ